MDGARNKNILFIHLETQYAKTNSKNEIYAKNWVRRTWTEKVNPEKVNGQRPVKVNYQPKSQRPNPDSEGDVSG